MRCLGRENDAVFSPLCEHAQERRGPTTSDAHAGGTAIERAFWWDIEDAALAEEKETAHCPYRRGCLRYSCGTGRIGALEK